MCRDMMGLKFAALAAILNRLHHLDQSSEAVAMWQAAQPCQQSSLMP